MLVESAVLLLSFAPTPEGDERPVAERGASAGPSKTSYSGSSGYSGPPFNEVEEGKCRYCPMREAIDGTWKADNLDDCKQACADKPSCKRIVFWAKNNGCPRARPPRARRPRALADAAAPQVRAVQDVRAEEVRQEVAPEAEAGRLRDRAPCGRAVHAREPREHRKVQVSPADRLHGEGAQDGQEGGPPGHERRQGRLLIVRAAAPRTRAASCTLRRSERPRFAAPDARRLPTRSAKLEAAKGIAIEKAVEGKFESASLFTTADVGDVRRAARLPAP